jgi:hypothetical protein
LRSGFVNVLVERPDHASDGRNDVRNALVWALFSGCPLDEEAQHINLAGRLPGDDDALPFDGCIQVDEGHRGFGGAGGYAEEDQDGHGPSKRSQNSVELGTNSARACATKQQLRDGLVCPAHAGHRHKTALRLGHRSVTDTFGVHRLGSPLGSRDVTLSGRLSASTVARR